jgi:hypothetical protein
LPPFSAIDPTLIASSQISSSWLNFAIRIEFIKRTLNILKIAAAGRHQKCRFTSAICRSGHCLEEVDPKVPKSIDKRQNELRRVPQSPASSQRAFQKLNSGYQFLVSSSFHPVWSGWYAVDYRARTAKPLPQPVSLQIGAGFAASSLALVNWIAEAGTAKITAYAFEQPSDAPMAVWAVHPRSSAAVVAVGPGNPNLLRRALIA